MSTTDIAAKAEQQEGRENLPQLAGPRLPYHPAIEERFGVDKAGWIALVEAIFPNAQTTESVILALSYCKARNLDPFKRNVHIVPIWDSKLKRLVDTIWPGIGELRTTAFRTGAYAGREETIFGPEITKTIVKVKVAFPEWAQVTVYRLVSGQRVAFAGSKVFWIETFSSTKDGSPNSMWQNRPRGQIDKCAEAAALRAAFPEELGDEFSSVEVGVIQHAHQPQLIEAESVEIVDDRPKSELLADQLAEKHATQLFEAKQAGSAKEETPDEPNSSRLFEIFESDMKATKNLEALTEVKNKALAESQIPDGLSMDDWRKLLSLYGELKKSFE